MEKKTIGAGILAFDKNSGKILFCRRGLKGDHPNTWCLFGGTFEEKDKQPKTTALREFVEETGCNECFHISKLPFFISDDNMLRFYTYVGIFDKPFNVKLNEENIDYAWFYPNHLPENLHPGVEKLFIEKNSDLNQLLDSIQH